MTDTVARSFSAAIERLDRLHLKPQTEVMARHFLRSEGRPICSKVLHHRRVGGMNPSARLCELRKAGFVINRITVCQCDERCRYERRVAGGRRPVAVSAFQLVAIPGALK